MSAEVTDEFEVKALRSTNSIQRFFAGFKPVDQLKTIATAMAIPGLSIVVFLFLWNVSSSRIVTSLGTVPGPTEVFQQAKGLWQEHTEEREKAEAFQERQNKRNAKKLAKNPDAVIKQRKYTGKPTFIDQVFTSLYTVFMGFVLAVLIAIPLGILCGLSKTMYTALNPLIQVFKPVSPLAWLPIVTMVVSALYVTDDPMFEKSFITSAITVTLCSLWPALINTTVGVASIDSDLTNVSKVLRLKWYTQVYKIVIPASLPMMFTGMRLSLGVGWMVLIAAEMLAQNPGLGKFVWDEFQNGSSNSLGRIMVAVFAIGIIGFILDRLMMTLQKLFSYDDGTLVR